jgi:phosphoglycolate phosphatase
MADGTAVRAGDGCRETGFESAAAERGTQIMHDVTIAFDLDGTLVDTAPDLTAAVNHVLALEGLAPVDPSRLRNDISHGAAEMLARAFAIHGHPIARSEVGRLYETVYLPRYAETIAVGSRPFPGLVGVLDRLQAAGARLVVCTNKWEGLSRKLLEELGLAGRFGAIAGRDTFAVCKPHPDHFIGAVRAAGGDPARAVMVGDSDTDIRTARAAGVPVIAVSFGYTDVPVRELGPSVVIDHFDEFDGALDRVLGGAAR